MPRFSCGHECDGCCTHNCSDADYYCTPHECGRYCTEENGCNNDDDECTHRCDDDCCGHECDEECDGIIHDYSYKPVPIFHGKGKLYFGWELEVAFQKSDFQLAEYAESIVGDEKLYYAKWDSSIGFVRGQYYYSGFEVVSHPGTIEFWRKTPLPLRALTRLGAKSYHTPTCGMHVHVSRSEISRIMLMHILNLFSYYDFVFALSRRNDPGHLDSYASPEARTDVVKKAHRYFAGARHEAVNCTNDSTIEFRIFKGTLWEPSFRRNLELVNAVIHWSRNVPMNYGGLRSNSHFCMWLESDDARKLIGRTASRELYHWVNECVSDKVQLEA